MVMMCHKSRRYQLVGQDQREEEEFVRSWMICHIVVILIYD
jgi:hypothetical protein